MPRSTGEDRSLLPIAGRPLAAAVTALCVLVIAALGAWLRDGMETGWLNKAVDASVQASLGGHPRLLAALVWPGTPVGVTAMAAALVLACILRRGYRQAAFVAISVPVAAGITELLLKPLIGRTPWGDPFPSGHVTSAAAVATAIAVLLAGTGMQVARLPRLVLGLAAFLMAGSVAIGVIGARMHYFTDTVGGAAVGAGTVLLTALTLDAWLDRRQPHRQNAGCARRDGGGQGRAATRSPQASGRPPPPTATRTGRPGPH